MSKTIPGINIQWPWSELLISGKKTIETRSYPIPKKHIGNELAVIETPGPKGKKLAGITKARIIGVIVFKECYQYKSQSHWAKENDLHLMSQDDLLYGYKTNKEKWAWVVESYKPIKPHKPAPSPRGIVFAKSCKV